MYLSRVTEDLQWQADKNSENSRAELGTRVNNLKASLKKNELVPTVYFSVITYLEIKSVNQFRQ